ncbi:MAG TPA: SOS response-associated peptidase [Mobilitalea sp.]|nr:SOS response-associated peptidase [Mobilitalea sp.]
MCGRYNFTVEQSDEVLEILEKLNAKFQGKEARTGEVFPTNLAPILIEEKKEISPTLSVWGFPKFDGKGVIINARSETAFEKKTFRDSLLNRRCIIPSTGFYEWDSEKRKYLFRLEGTNALYMAGLYMYSGEEMRYVILTTDANESMKEIHNRMPLVILKEDIGTWIMDHHVTNDILHRVPPQLIREAV